MLNIETPRVYACTVCAVLLTAACSSSDSDSVPTNENGKIDVYYGHIDILDEPGTPDASASFRKTEMDHQTFELFKMQSRLLKDESEKCLISGATLDGEVLPSPFSTFELFSFPLDLSDESQNWEYLSAGEVILLSSDAGSYAELVLTMDEDFLFYEVSGGDVPPEFGSLHLPDPIPEQLNITIPGDDFPAVSGVSLAKPTPLSNIKVDSLELTDYDFSLTYNTFLSLDSVITWDPDNVGNVQLYLGAGIVHIAPDIDTSEFSVFCTLADDGHFVLPQSTVQELTRLIGADVQLGFGSMHRQTSDVRTQNQGRVLFEAIRKAD